MLPTRYAKKSFLCIAVLTGLALLPLIAGADGQFDRRTPLVIAVEKVGPAVVNIYTQEAPRKAQNPFRGFFGDDVYQKYFRDYSPPTQRGKRSLGSGVLIDPRGYILTNQHVVSRAQQIKITLIDKREFDASLIGADAKSDLAVIKINSDKPLPFVRMGRSNDLMIGETVIAIGNPFGLQHTVTSGIISALNRNIQVGDNVSYSDFIQVDVPINPGNSGGPLLNINGLLIGVNATIRQGAEGIGFAIPIDNARRIVDDLIEFGKVQRGWLGVSVKNITDDLARVFELPNRQGALITKVFKQGPMQKAKMIQGDIIVTIDGREVADKAAFQDKINSYTINDVINFEFLRGGRRYQGQVRVSPMPKTYGGDFAHEWLGIKVENLSRKLAQSYQLSSQSGVVVTSTISDSVSGKVGISPGDVIRQVNKNKINNEEDFHKAVFEASKLTSVLLLVQRGRFGYYVTLEP